MKDYSLGVIFGIVIATIATLYVAPVVAKEAKTARPEIFQKLVDCRSVVADAARLACYDAQTALLDEAEKRNDVVVVDKEQIKTARKGLFGITLPDLGIFGGEKGDQPDQALNEIESTIKSARTTVRGNWIIILDDGAKWIQTETVFIFDPKPGQPVRIRKGPLGSFLVNINGRPAIRMKREN